MKEICKAIRRIASPDDMMKFFDENISYGCVHADATRYVDSLGGSTFQEMYRTMSLEESLNNRLGACFEQANISKFIYEILGIPCMTFCTRGFTNEHPYPMTYILYTVMSLGSGEIKSLMWNTRIQRKKGFIFMIQSKKLFERLIKSFPRNSNSMEQRKQELMNMKGIFPAD